VDTESGMDAEEVLAIVGWLSQRAVVYQINGGWAVDALHASQTRVHRDVDIFLDEDHLAALKAWLQSRGYATVEDWLPTRIELRHERHMVDLHPIVLDAFGNGVQQGLNGELFHHRADARTEGWINGHPVIVATAERLRELRQGYEQRDVDLHDLAILDALWRGS
jgi:lincosamide nucleotidyltransferase A/C/D/E